MEGLCIIYNIEGEKIKADIIPEKKSHKKKQSKCNENKTKQTEP